MKTIIWIKLRGFKYIEKEIGMTRYIVDDLESYSDD